MLKEVKRPQTVTYSFFLFFSTLSSFNSKHSLFMIVHSQERLSRKPSPLFPSLISGGKLGEQLRTFSIHSPVNTTYSFILVHCQERQNDERKGETELLVNPQLSLNETVNMTYSFILVHCQERLSIPSFSFSSPQLYGVSQFS